MGRNMRVIVLSAFPPELEALGGAFPSEVVGVGLVQAALGAARVARAMAGSKDPMGVLVGTCGAYPGSGLGIGDVVEATGHLLADGAEALGRAALVGTMSEPLPASMRLGAGTPGLVATTLAICTDDTLAERLARRTGAAVEHLEAYAVAAAFAEADVPLAVVLGVANAVGAKGRDEWRQNHRAAAGAALRAVRRALAS
jgi:futalosine hydrolase